MAWVLEHARTYTHTHTGKPLPRYIFNRQEGLPLEKPLSSTSQGGQERAQLCSKNIRSPTRPQAAQEGLGE